MKQFIIMIIAAAFLATACNVKQEISFDKDHSGSAKFEIDYNQLMSTMEGFQGEMTLDDKSKQTDKEVQKLKKEVNGIEGISNFEVSDNPEEGIVSFSYDFKDIASFDNAMNASKTQSDNTGKSVISINDDKLVFDFWGSELSSMNEATEIAEDAEESEEGEDAAAAAMGGMDDMFSSIFEQLQYTMVMNFDKPVKGVSNELFTLSDDKKQVTLEVNMGDIIANGADLKLEIEL